jgi:WD repeat-containing protein 7
MKVSLIAQAAYIIPLLMLSFPNIDFHMSSQRLAVGTSEGTVVMYDLKSATRLYVLEGHKSRPAACSFSPDGRRLVTVSLKEGVVMVWKVGSSFTSLFNLGAPPRQGHAGSEPYKTLSFNVGDQGKFICKCITGVRACLDERILSQRTCRYRRHSSM